jgi:hypothetical protein
MGAEVHSASRGVVVFRDGTSLLWEDPDGHRVVAWAQWHDSPKSNHARQHGGVHFALVYQLINMEVIYEAGP